jgi:hypothetical protein
MRAVCPFFLYSESHSMAGWLRDPLLAAAFDFLALKKGRVDEKT